MTTTFKISGSTANFTLLDLDFLVRYEEKGQTERLVSAKVLHEELSKIDEKHFIEFFNRAYMSGKDETVCKLRRGIKVTFVLR